MCFTNMCVLHRHVCASPTCVASSSVELGSFGIANGWPKDVNLGATIPCSFTEIMWLTLEELLVGCLKGAAFRTFHPILTPQKIPSLR